MSDIKGKCRLPVSLFLITLKRQHQYIIFKSVSQVQWHCLEYKYRAMCQSRSYMYSLQVKRMSPFVQIRFGIWAGVLLQTSQICARIFGVFHCDPLVMLFQEISCNSLPFLSSKVCTFWNGLYLQVWSIILVFKRVEKSEPAQLITIHGFCMSKDISHYLRIGTEPEISLLVRTFLFSLVIQIFNIGDAF